MSFLQIAAKAAAYTTNTGNSTTTNTEALSSSLSSTSSSSSNLWQVTINFFATKMKSLLINYSSGALFIQN